MCLAGGDANAAIPVTLLRTGEQNANYGLGCAAKNCHMMSVAGTWLPLMRRPGHMWWLPWMA
ncbi:MAG: hypothetical protein WBE13_12485 [Candidatus Acidiferrum sp.]